jgi:hypothetical protein
MANVFVCYPFLKKAKLAPVHYVHGSVAHPVDGIFIARLKRRSTLMVLASKA